MIIFCTENMFEQMPDKKPLLKYPIHITNAFEQAVSRPISAHVQPIQRWTLLVVKFMVYTMRLFRVVLMMVYLKSYFTGL
ncbi:hypothetical protein L3X38_038448 [Prunus dulcis]|uniref:Uncharacterized protein n=1 Tax=Prunus dulcis TaxID=3755 RepID=A0AAD4V5B7_PRUDU|nr:hypothetical protein L3X38_038448 [Prunus dulcis]